MSGPDLGALVRGARASGAARRRRVVCRFDAGEVAELDALRARFPKATRAAIIRALCAVGTAVVRAAAAPEAAP